MVELLGCRKAARTAVMLYRIMKITRLPAALVALPLCMFLLCHGARAQQNENTVKDSKAATTRKKHKSILDLVPVRDYTIGQNLPPLTPDQKFHLALNNSVIPFVIAEAAVKAEYYRATNPRKKIGYGGTGYLKQWGAAYLDEVSGTMFNTFLYPTLLHQDPRYYRKDEGSIASRVAYSFSRVFVTRSDSGRKEFNASMVLGSITSTALSNAYYPPRARGVGITLGNIGWSLVDDGASNVFREFWPDVARRLRKDH